MGGAFRAVGRAVGGIARGIGSAVGGVVRGVGHLFQGRPLKALGSVVGGVAKGAGHVLKGGLGAAKDILGDPLLMGVAGFATFGIGGAIAAPLLGKLGSGIFGAAEQGVSNLFGLNAQPAQGQMQYQNNYGNYGQSNGIVAGGCVGGTYGGGYGFPGVAFLVVAFPVVAFPVVDFRSRSPVSSRDSSPAAFQADMVPSSPATAAAAPATIASAKWRRNILAK